MKINKVSQISTKNGDRGTSRDFSNNEFYKDNVLFHLLGSIDELSSSLGIAFHYSSFKEEIKTIQQNLQIINSMIATTNPPTFNRIDKITEKDVDWIEKTEQIILEKTIIEPRFVLPGSEGTKESAYLDLSRSIVRRVERHLVHFIQEKKRTNIDICLQYVNRLSDLLFIMARNKEKGE